MMKSKQINRASNTKEEVKHTVTTVVDVKLLHLGRAMQFRLESPKSEKADQF